MRFRILLLASLVVLIAVLVILATHRFVPTNAPWEETGTLVVAVFPVPYAANSLSLGLGIDDMFLNKKDGERIRASMLTRRVIFDSDQEGVHVLFNTNVPTGAYGGFEFTLKSPELRNDWKQDEAPTSVTLPHEKLVLPTSYAIHEDETTVVLLGFETMQAIHKREDGDVYLPVIQVETRVDASVWNTEDGVTHVEGGSILTSATYGMDWDGRMRHNFRAKK